MTILALFLYGYALQRLVLNMVVRAQLFLALLITFGVEVVMINVARMLWSSDLRQVTLSYAASNFALGPITIP